MVSADTAGNTGPNIHREHVVEASTKPNPSDPRYNRRKVQQRVIRRGRVQLVVGGLLALSLAALVFHEYFQFFGGDEEGDDAGKEQGQATAQPVQAVEFEQVRAEQQRRADENRPPAPKAFMPADNAANMNALNQETGSLGGHSGALRSSTVPVASPVAAAAPPDNTAWKAERESLLEQLSLERLKNQPKPTLYFETSSRPWEQQDTGGSRAAAGSLGSSSAALSDPSLALPAAAAPAGLPARIDPNGQVLKRQFLEQQRRPAHYTRSGLQAPRSPYELKAPTHIPAVLVTGINSDLPGPVTAMVNERLYDTVTGQHLLVPQGSYLLADYDSMVAYGQERVLLCWQRMVLPNGKSIDLECMPATDVRGMAGVSDQVDNHWDRIIGAAGMSTILNLGVQVAAGRPSGATEAPSLIESAGVNAAADINSAGQAIVRRNLLLQPTITVRQGYPILVALRKDLILEPYEDIP